MNMTRRQRAVQAAARAAYDGRQPTSRREAAEWEALRRGNARFGAQRAVRAALRPCRRCGSSAACGHR